MTEHTTWTPAPRTDRPAAAGANPGRPAALELDSPLALARRLSAALEALERAPHGIRLARALMLDVIELLEGEASTLVH
jgi:hypothetical protein